jgi:hypothetical protein
MMQQIIKSGKSKLNAIKNEWPKSNIGKENLSVPQQPAHRKI